MHSELERIKKMAELVYILCAATSFLCAALSWRGHRKNANKLLFWTSLCFIGFALNNLILFIDSAIYPEYNLSVWRLLPALIGSIALIFGLVRQGSR
jgi:hypothetical protein